MEIAGLFVTAFIVGFSGAMMPGPLLTVTIGETARHGFGAAPLIVLGHVLLELLLVLAVAAGLAKFFTPGVSRWVAIMGGGFLLFMGWRMMRDGIGGSVSLPGLRSEAVVNEAQVYPSADRSFKPRLVLAGALISLANPYWILWWATVGLGYITMALKSGALGISSFFTGHILSDVVWYLMAAGAIAQGRRFFSDTVYRWIVAVCGIFLLGLGGYFIYSGFFS